MIARPGSLNSDCDGGDSEVGFFHLAKKPNYCAAVEVWKGMTENKKRLSRMLLHSLKVVSTVAQLCLLTVTTVWGSILWACRSAISAPLRFQLLDRSLWPMTGKLSSH